MRDYLKCCLLLSFCFLGPLKAESQTNGGKYNFVPIDDDIPKSAITSILQDKKGLIWVGTNGSGLFKYNGTDLKVYKHDPNDSTSINSSLVNTLFLDSKNRIWVGTQEGLNVYDISMDTFRNISIGQKDSKGRKFPIFSIGENTQGQLLAGTPGHGLYKVNIETFIVERVYDDKLPNGSESVVNSLAPLDNGELLVGTNKGLFSYDNIHNILKRKYYNTSDGPKGIDYSIKSMLIDKEKNVWIGTYNHGLICVKKKLDGFYSINEHAFTDKRIFEIEMTPDNTIICGTENDGLFVLDLEGKPIHQYKYDKSDPNSIRSNSVWSVFVDGQERIWLGYYNKGIGVYDALYDKFMGIQSLPYMKNSLQSPSVTGVVQDSEGQFWIGMDGGGIDKYNPETKEFHHLLDPNNGIISGLDKSDVQTLYLDKEQNLWAGTWDSGIYYLPKGGSQFVNYNTDNTDGGLTSNSITSISEDSNGIIWIATFFNGLHSFDPKKKEFSNHSGDSFKKDLVNQGHIRKVLVDHNDHIWLGTTLGLFKISKKSETKYLTQSYNKLLFDDTEENKTTIIRTLFEDSSDHIWLGTYEKGLCRINTESDEIEWFNIDNGLSIESVSSIIEDRNNNIWVGGDSGIAMLNMKTKRFSNYTMGDGLLANNYNYSAVAQDNNGLLYFGNYEGIDYFNPESIIKNVIPPTVYFTDLKLFKKSVFPSEEGSPLKKNISVTNQLTLSHKQFVFTIEFAAINFTRTNNNQYAYFLEGFEEDWNYVGNTRTATYTNLSPDDYTFYVKASNNDGVWTDTPISLPITVLAPWWATKWAYLLYILLFTGLAFIIYWFLKARIEEKRAVKLERAQRQQEEILNEKKIQFFTNISHEFRTPLTLILNPLIDIIESNQYKLNKSLTEKHTIIFRNAKRLKNLIDELMDFRKFHTNRWPLNLSKIDVFKFVSEIAEHFEEEAFDKNILLSTETDGNRPDFWGDPSLLEKTVFNLLSNAFKATPENGVITVGVYVCKQKVLFPLVHPKTLIEALEITIEDTGSGISKDDIAHIFERFYRAKDRNQQYYGGSGTGIGLELVQSFVQLHKGKIVVESEEGEGTQFKLFFPLGNKHLKTSENTVSTISVTPELGEYSRKNVLEEVSKSVYDPSGLGREGGTKKTVLLVEDNSELRNYLKSKLRSEYVVVEAEDGKKGLQMALKGIPDIIITDVIMPEMDGFEFSQQIKGDLRTSHIPVIMLTAKAMSSDKIKGIDSGADAYLNKPFEMKLLNSYLKRLLESRQLFLKKNINDENKITLLQNTTNIDKSFMQKVLHHINENIGESDLNVEHLADDMSLSRSQLYRKIKAITGMTVNELIRKIRLERAKQMIEQGNESISEIGFKVGFSSPSYFSKCFKNEFGILPTELKTTS